MDSLIKLLILFFTVVVAVSIGCASIGYLVVGPIGFLNRAINSLAIVILEI